MEETVKLKKYKHSLVMNMYDDDEEDTNKVNLSNDELSKTERYLREFIYLYYKTFKEELDRRFGENSHHFCKNYPYNVHVVSYQYKPGYIYRLEPYLEPNTDMLKIEVHHIALLSKLGIGKLLSQFKKFKIHRIWFYQDFSDLTPSKAISEARRVAKRLYDNSSLV